MEANVATVEGFLNFTSTSIKRVSTISSRTKRPTASENLKRLRGKLASLEATVDSFATDMGNWKVDSEDAREKVREVAVTLAVVAKGLSPVLDLYDTMVMVPEESEQFRRDLETVICKVEDMAETAALASSLEFAQLVAKEIESTGG